MVPDILWSVFPADIAQFIMGIFCALDGLAQGLVRGFAPIEQVPSLLNLLEMWWEVLFT